MADHNEAVFETEICAYLKAHGWLYSADDTGYDRERALFAKDLFEWLEETHPAPPLLPATAAERAVVRAMATIVACDIHPLNNLRIQQALEGADGPIVAATDYMKIVADQVAPWLPGRMETLGTDGFGRSENREYLRRHFEINAESIAVAALSRLARDGQFPVERAKAAFGELGVNPEKIDSARA